MHPPPETACEVPPMEPVSGILSSILCIRLPTSSPSSGPDHSGENPCQRIPGRAKTCPSVRPGDRQGSKGRPGRTCFITDNALPELRRRFRFTVAVISCSSSVASSQRRVRSAASMPEGGDKRESVIGGSLYNCFEPCNQTVYPGPDHQRFSSELLQSGHSFSLQLWMLEERSEEHLRQIDTPDALTTPP